MRSLLEEQFFQSIYPKNTLNAAFCRIFFAYTIAFIPDTPLRKPENNWSERFIQVLDKFCDL